MARRSRRPDGQSPRSIERQTILKGWDFHLALVAFVLVLVVTPFREALPFDTSEHVSLWPLATTMVVLSLGIWLGERWLADRIAGSDYGELVGMVDPDNSALLLPYHVTAVVSFAAAIATGGATLLAPQVDALWVHAVLYGLVAFACTWAVCGFLSLLGLTRHHMQRQAEVRSLRERWEAEQRMPESNGA